MVQGVMVLFQSMADIPHLPDFKRSSVLGVIAGHGRG
jgi:hypothetical protein